MEIKTKNFNNLTQTGFDLELLRLNQLILRKCVELNNLKKEAQELLKAAQKQNLKF